MVTVNDSMRINDAHDMRINDAHDNGAETRARRAS